MSKLVKPHGSSDLKPLLLEGAEAEEEIKRAESLPKVFMSSRETSCGAQTTPAPPAPTSSGRTP